MNISYNWLKQYLSIGDKTADEVAKDLTSIGLEVGSVEKFQSIRGGLEGLVVGEVLTCTKHPNSDHLHITTVNVGQEEPLKIVCGAPNVAAGQKVVVATIGTVLYSGDEKFTIKRSKIRGEESFGMLCAEDEIGIGESHAGIIVLPNDVKVGTLVKDYYQIQDDTIIEVDITPNRSDAASHYGVARDLAAHYAVYEPNITLNPQNVEDFCVNNKNLTIPVTVENVDACPRYSAVTISGVSIHESPSWLKNYISAIGLRPINNVVDATNFVLHAMGQPIHAFDADKIKGGKVIVKNMPAETLFVTLDGVERKLHQDDLVICNEKEPMCLAGVFGGLDSGVTEQTKNIFIESAYFNPVTIRKTARRHGLNTDASFRYERGCDPNNTLYILKFAALTIMQVAGGEVSSDIFDSYPNPIKPCEVKLSYNKLFSLIGKTLDKDMVKTILKNLEMNILSQSDEELTLQIPTYRVDVTRDVDVIEDVLRIYGYNNVEIPTSVKSSISQTPKVNTFRKQNIISDQLTACGFNEIMNNSLTKISYYTSNAELPEANCVKIMNPLSQDLSVMRQTLLFGGLETIARNINHRMSNLKLYEFGNCYFFSPEAETTPENLLKPYSESFNLALWITGNKENQTWLRAEEKTSFFELKAYVENIFRKLGIKFNYVRSENKLFTEALEVISCRKKKIATLGSVSASLLKSMGISVPVFYAELNWKTMMKEVEYLRIQFSDIAKYPEVKRDFALLIDKNISFADIEAVAKETERKYLKSMTLFDVYEGKNLPAGKKSYAVNFTLQDETKTLTDNQIDAIMNKLRVALENKLGAALR